MKRYILLFALAALQSLTMMADDGWHVYAAYHDARQTVFMHGKAYVLSDGSLFSYDPEDTSVETYTKANVMSDFGIFSILPCEKTNELIVIYTNGNIDIMDAKGNVFNIPDLKLKSLSDKTINDVLCEDGMLFICTSSGVVCFDMEKHLFGDFYSFENPVRTILVSDGFYYVATNKEILKGKIGDNLLDPARWSQVRTASWVLKLFKFNENIYCMQPSAIVRITNVEKFTVKAFLSSVKCNSWKVQDGRLFLQLTEGGVYELTGEEETVKIEGSDGIYDLTFGGGQAWAACGADGLKAYKLGDDHVLTETLSSVIPNSPQRNFSYRLSMAPNQRLLVAGGAFNYPDVTQAGTVMKYENGTWTTFDEENPVAEAGSRGYINVTDVVQDPLDSEHHWVSLARSGLYEFRDYKMVNHYSYDNSPLESILPDGAHPDYYVRVTALTFDSQNNLWMCNNETESIFRILRKDGTWTSYNLPDIEYFTTFDRTIFDRRGWAWTNSRRSAPTSKGRTIAGFVVIDTHGNPGNPAGFTHRFISTYTNQDGTSYSPYFFNCITEDLDGAMWFGNVAGLFMTATPANVFDANFTLTQIKVPRNDGSNLADYLLNGVQVKCITIDGGNRKWIGTSGNGVYLISADGMEQLEHFTTDNSPLISDGIYDIAIDGKTGEVFIATDAGLVSFHGDATDPAASLDENNVKVYPNPVRPEYNGNITITGLAYNTNVKIVNASGRLVNEGTSVGGEYHWNGCLASGQRCASGIYYVLAADEGGNNGVAAKFLMVKE